MFRKPNQANSKGDSLNEIFFYTVTKAGFTVLMSVLLIYGVAHASTVKITPPGGTPVANFYSLSEIYNFITSNTTSSEGSPALDWSSALEDTGRTLTEVYSALAGLIATDKVKLGTTYLNVAGTLVPNGGTAAAADVFNGQTAHLTADWTLDTGVLNLACNTPTFDGTSNLVATGYDGFGDGTNRWCVTDSGNAIAGDMLFGKIAWVDGQAVTGTMTTNTLSDASDTVNAGYFAATTLSTVDTDLAVGNIKNGVTVFGKTGNYPSATNALPGDTVATDAVTGNILAGLEAWTKAGDLLTGTMVNNGAFSLAAGVGDQAVTAGYYSGGTLAGDTDLVAGKIKTGTTIFGVAGDYPSVTNPLPGDTVAIDAGIGQILSGAEAWTKTGGLLTGTMANNSGAVDFTPAVTSVAIPIGFYDGVTKITGDADLVTGNIKSGITIFGVSGKTEVIDTTEATLPITAGTVLANKVGFVNGSQITGTMVNKVGSATSVTPSTADQAIAVGYYGGALGDGKVLGDADLVVTNIASGVNIFGVIGSLIAYLYGDNDASKVLTTATTAGTFSVANLTNSAIKKGVTWGASLGQTGLLFGDTDASKVLTTADGGGAATGTYNAANLSTTTVKKGTAFGVSLTGTYSGYAGTGWSGTSITQSACDAQNPTWYWFEDANGDGDTTDAEDGVCVRATAVTSLSWNGAEQIGTTNITGRTATGGTANTVVDADGTAMTANAYANEVVVITSGTAATCWGVVKSNTTTTITVYGSWMTSTPAATAYASNCGTPDATSVFTVARDGFDDYDNSWIGDWTCTGSFPTGAPSWGSFPTSAQVGAGFIALATTDCYDGTRDLLPTEASRAVKTGTATAADATTITDTALLLNTNAWVGQKVLITGGTGSGGSGRIQSNTGTVITVDSWTGGSPGAGSTFAIVYLIPHAAYNPTTDILSLNAVGAAVTVDNDPLNGNLGPLTQAVLNAWTGTKLPTASDFFGYCGTEGDGTPSSAYKTSGNANTTDKTYGDYGGQVGRTGEFLDLANTGSWEWLSEQHYYLNARVAGAYACSNFSLNSVSNGHRFRAVFRP